MSTSPAPPPTAAQGGGGPSSVSPPLFARQTNSSSAPPAPAPTLRASSDPKLGGGAGLLGGGALAGGGSREGVQGGGGEDELVRQRRVSAGNAQAASMTKTESEGGTHAFKPHSNLDIEALIALATSHSPPSGYVNSNRSSTPNFVYGQSSPYSHSGTGTPVGGLGGIPDTRVALFVGNLPFRVRWQDLKDLMRRAGTVLRADVSLGPDNRSKGHGMVLMGSREDGMRAIDMFNGYNWQTRILEVRPERLPPEYEQHAPSTASLHKQASSSSLNFQQPQPGLNHNSIPHMFLHHAHSGVPNGSFNNGLRSTSPYASGVRPPFPQQQNGSSPGLRHASPSLPPSNITASPAPSLLSNNSGNSMSSPAPSSASPSLSAALLNHSQQQHIARSLTPKATSATPNQPPSDLKSLEQALSSNLRISSSPQPRETSPSRRAAPPGSLGGLPLPPSFNQVGQAMQSVNVQNQSSGQRSSSRGPDNLSGRVLFVGNLPFHFQWQDLKDLFRAAGNIQRANVALGGDGRSRGFGSVQYSTKEDAEVAIRLFEGYDLNGRRLQVHHESADVSRSQHPAAGVLHQVLPTQQQSQASAQRQQMPPLQMNFTRPTTFGHEGAFFMPPSPYHGPPSPFHAPPQSPSAYGPPSPFHYFPPSFGMPNAFNGSYPSAQVASTALPSTAEEPSRKDGGTLTAGTGEAAQQPIGPPRGHPPGRIALPPAYPFHNGPPSAGSAMSPMHTRGLPMFTPSMPSFQFHNGFPQTPPLFPQFLSPGLGPMSPPLHSPPVFNPYMNAAPGAPVTGFMTQDNPMFPPSVTYHQNLPPSQAPPSTTTEGDDEEGTNGQSGGPVGPPVFASLSRDGSFSAPSGQGEQDGEGHSGDEGGERSRTPMPASPLSLQEASVEA